MLIIWQLLVHNSCVLCSFMSCCCLVRAVCVCVDLSNCVTLHLYQNSRLSKHRRRVVVNGVIWRLLTLTALDNSAWCSSSSCCHQSMHYSRWSAKCSVGWVQSSCHTSGTVQAPATPRPGPHTSRGAQATCDCDSIWSLLLTAGVNVDSHWQVSACIILSLSVSVSGRPFHWLCTTSHQQCDVFMRSIVNQSCYQIPTSVRLLTLSLSASSTSISTHSERSTGLLMELKVTVGRKTKQLIVTTLSAVRVIESSFFTAGFYRLCVYLLSVESWVELICGVVWSADIAEWQRVVSQSAADTCHRAVSVTNANLTREQPTPVLLSTTLLNINRFFTRVLLNSLCLSKLPLHLKRVAILPCETVIFTIAASRLQFELAVSGLISYCIGWTWPQPESRSLRPTVGTR